MPGLVHACVRGAPLLTPADSTHGSPPARDRKEPTLSDYLLKLYVTGKNPRAEKAIANLRRICEEDLNGRYELQIIDVLEDPQLAEDEKILATPTLIKRLPLPLRRVIGDLSDKDKVLLGLDVWPDPPAESETEAS
jgi:circadian clock protein KaiB